MGNSVQQTGLVSVDYFLVVVSFFGQVRGVLCVLRLGAEQLGAVGEELVVCYGRRSRASGQTPP